MDPGVLRVLTGIITEESPNLLCSFGQRCLWAYDCKCIKWLIQSIWSTLPPTDADWWIFKRGRYVQFLGISRWSFVVLGFLHLTTPPPPSPPLSRLAHKISRISNFIGSSIVRSSILLGVGPLLLLCASYSLNHLWVLMRAAYCLVFAEAFHSYI